MMIEQDGDGPPMMVVDPPAGPEPPVLFSGNSPEPGDEELVIEQDGDGPPRIVGGSGPVPPELLRGLFPGPLLTNGIHGRSAETPDAMVMNMLQDMDGRVANDVLPAAKA